MCLPRRSCSSVGFPMIPFCRPSSTPNRFGRMAVECSLTNQAYRLPQAALFFSQSRRRAPFPAGQQTEHILLGSAHQIVYSLLARSERSRPYWSVVRSGGSRNKAPEFGRESFAHLLWTAHHHHRARSRSYLGSEAADCKYTRPGITGLKSPLQQHQQLIWDWAYADRHLP